MKIRSDLYLNNHSQLLTFVQGPQDTKDRVLLRLAAALFYGGYPLITDPSIQHPALWGQEYVPDFFVTNDTNDITLWIQCGKTTINKLEKISKRFHHARFVMLLGLPHEGQQMADTVSSSSVRQLEIWSFQKGEFERWRHLVTEKNDIIGESSESNLNLVINNDLFVTDLIRFH